MTEKELSKALELYKAWVLKFHFHEGLTNTEWDRLISKENLTTADQKVLAEWEESCNDPQSTLNQAANYVNSLVEEGRVSELPEDIQDLIKRWNK